MDTDVHKGTARQNEQMVSSGLRRKQTVELMIVFNNLTCANPDR